MMDSYNEILEPLTKNRYIYILSYPFSYHTYEFRQQIKEVLDLLQTKVPDNKLDAVYLASEKDDELIELYVMYSGSGLNEPLLKALILKIAGGMNAPKT